MTLIRDVLACVLGLIYGGGVATGVIALITGLGVIPRIVGKSTTARHILLYENFLIAGASLGCFLVILELDLRILGSWFLVFAGVFAGIFAGCLSAALAEVIQIWPVLYRRIGAKYGIRIAMTCFAVGKLVGGLYYFLRLKYQI